MNARHTQAVRHAISNPISKQLPNHPMPYLSKSAMVSEITCLVVQVSGAVVHRHLSSCCVVTKPAQQHSNMAKKVEECSG